MQDRRKGLADPERRCLTSSFTSLLRAIAPPSSRYAPAIDTWVAASGQAAPYGRAGCDASAAGSGSIAGTRSGSRNRCRRAPSMRAVGSTPSRTFEMRTESPGRTTSTVISAAPAASWPRPAAVARSLRRPSLHPVWVPRRTRRPRTSRSQISEPELGVVDSYTDPHGSIQANVRHAWVGLLRIGR